jgi:hypothetical protein
MGLPITITRTLRVAEVRTVADSMCGGRSGVVLGIEPREQGGRKVLRRRLVTSEMPTAWTAASGPLVHVFVEWWRRMRDEGATYVFPRFRPGSDTTYDGSACIGARALQEGIKLVAPGSQWHDLRRGMEHAIDQVHKLEGGPATEVSAAVKNAIALRSNLAERGSRDTYIHDVAAALFEATRHMHRVEASMVGGLVLTPGDGLALAAADQPFATTCGWCDSDIGVDDEGAMCDHDGCMWTLCSTCWSRPPSEELRCPAHELSDDDDDSDGASASS